jgi:hypothetical protein
LPAVATSQNGSGTSATRKDVFDDHGYHTWSMDERGFFTHKQYDVPSGAVVQRIDDVDTGVVSVAPSGWSTPSGSGLNPVTDYEIDDLGWHTEMPKPTHTIDLGGTATAVRSATWTVRKDGEHEVWVGRGYATQPNPSRYSSLDGEDCEVTIANCKFHIEPTKGQKTTVMMLVNFYFAITICQFAMKPTIGGPLVCPPMATGPDTSSMKSPSSAIILKHNSAITR